MRRAVTPHRMLRFLPACVAAGLAASVLVAVALVMLGGRDAWAQVVKTVQSKALGEMHASSPRRRSVASGFRAPGRLVFRQEQDRRQAIHEGREFVDFARQEAREYDPKKIRYPSPRSVKTRTRISDLSR